MENQVNILEPPTELVYDQPHFGIATCILNRIYVSWISKKITPKQLQCIFRPHGKVVHANVIQHSKYGFVTFQYEEDVKKLLNRVREGKLTIYFGQYKVNIQQAYYSPRRVARAREDCSYPSVVLPWDTQTSQLVNVHNLQHPPVWYQSWQQIPEQTICQSQQQMVIPVQLGLPNSPYGLHQTPTEPVYFC